MKLLSAHIKAFGKLENVSLDISQGLNIILQDNSFGKTTLAHFIKAVLYGFDYVRRGGDNDASYFYPWGWSGTHKYGGFIVYEENGKEYRLERSFGSTAKQEQAVLTELATGKNLDCHDVGKRLTGLSAEAFLQSVFVPQEAVSVSANTDFEQRLAGMLEASDADNNFDKAITKLRDYSKTYKYEKGNGGLIFDLSQKKFILQQQMQQVKQNLQRAEELTEELNELNKQAAEAQAKQKQLESTATSLTAEIAATENSTAAIEDRRELQKLRQTVDSGGNLFAADLKDAQQLYIGQKEAVKNAKPYLLILAATLTVAAAICFILQQFAFAIPLLIFGIGIFTAWIYLKLRDNKAAKAVQENKTKLVEILSKHAAVDPQNLQNALEKLWEKSRAHDTDYAKMQILSNRVQAAEKTGTFKQKENLADVSTQLDGLKSTMLLLQTQIGEKQEKRRGLLIANNFAQLESDLTATEQDLQNALYNYNTAQQTIELIKQAKENLSSAYLPKLTELCGSLLGTVSHGVFTNVVIDKEFNVSICENGSIKSAKFFSRGVRELCAFCFRIALSTLIYNGTIPMLILDDTFVNLDDVKFNSAMELLQTLSQKTQILYFTCHQRVKSTVEKPKRQ